jgi:hypothetical protein
MMKRLLLASAVVFSTGAGFALGGAYGPRLIGTGYLTGWTVQINGRDICDDPYVWDATHEIECD